MNPHMFRKARNRILLREDPFELLRISEYLPSRDTIVADSITSEGRREIRGWDLYDRYQDITEFFLGLISEEHIRKLWVEAEEAKEKGDHPDTIQKLENKHACAVRLKDRYEACIADRRTEDMGYLLLGGREEDKP